MKTALQGKGRSAGYARDRMKMLLVSERIDCSPQMIKKMCIRDRSTQFSIITDGKIIISKKIPSGGRQMNEAICSEIRKRYSLQIGTRTGKRLKLAMGKMCIRDRISSRL